MEIFGSVLEVIGFLGGLVAFFTAFGETGECISKNKADYAVYFALKGAIVCVAFILLGIAGVLLSR